MTQLELVNPKHGHYLYNDPFGGKLVFGPLVGGFSFTYAGKIGTVDGDVFIGDGIEVYPLLGKSRVHALLRTMRSQTHAFTRALEAEAMLRQLEEDYASL